MQRNTRLIAMTALAASMCGVGILSALLALFALVRALLSDGTLPLGLYVGLGSCVLFSAAMSLGVRGVLRARTRLLEQPAPPLPF